MAENEARCEVAACSKILTGPSFYDKHYKKRMCTDCFNQAFRLAEQNGFGEWFESNYDKEAYPLEFWRKVGAFVDLSNTNTSAYR